jgi:1,4-alpha-glucan branching enzyme
VRSLRPDAKDLAIVDRYDIERRFPASRIAEEGLFEAELRGVTEAFDYLLEVTTWSGEICQISDPYSYGPVLGELDTYLYCMGNHYEIYEKLGAHLREINGHAGVSFAVWAPNAQRVSVVGDFNSWDGRTHPMRRRIEAGIWEPNLRMFYAWMYAHPGKKLLFMGGEIGQWKEWNYNQSLDWDLLQDPLHNGLRRLVQHLNFLYKRDPTFSESDDSFAGFEWIDFSDADKSIFTFLRKAQSGSTLLFAVNATPVPRNNYRVGAPGKGWYEEFLNTDARIYGGGNIGNWGGRHAEPIPWQGRSHSLCLTLPPLSTIGFRRHDYN